MCREGQGLLFMVAAYTLFLHVSLLYKDVGFFDNYRGDRMSAVMSNLFRLIILYCDMFNIVYFKLV